MIGRERSLVAAIGVLTATLIAQAGAAQEFKLNLANEYPAASLPALADKDFADAIKARSGGKIEVVLHHNGSLGYKSRDHYNAVADGAVQLASTPFDKIIGLAPIYALQTLPFVTPTIDKTEVLLHIARPYYEAAFNKANQTMLFAEPWTPSGVWAKSRLGSIDELKGLKVRTIDSLATKTFRDAGAAPIQMAWGDVLPALTTNVITAVQTSDEGGVSVKIWEAGAKYFNFIGYGMGISAVTMNLDAFKKLPPDLQKAVRDVSAETEKKYWTLVRSRVDANKKVMADAGAVFVDDVPKPVIEHLMKAGAPMLDEWKKQMGPDSEKILAEFNSKAGS